MSETRQRERQRERETEGERVVEGGRQTAEKQLTVRAAPHSSTLDQITAGHSVKCSFKVTMKPSPCFQVCLTAIIRMTISREVVYTCLFTSVAQLLVFILSEVR